MKSFFFFIFFVGLYKSPAYRTLSRSKKDPEEKSHKRKWSASTRPRPLRPLRPLRPPRPLRPRCPSRPSTSSMSLSAAPRRSASTATASSSCASFPRRSARAAFSRSGTRSSPSSRGNPASGSSYRADQAVPWRRRISPRSRAPSPAPLRPRGASSSNADGRSTPDSAHHATTTPSTCAARGRCARTPNSTASPLPSPAPRTSGSTSTAPSRNYPGRAKRSFSTGT